MGERQTQSAGRDLLGRHLSLEFGHCSIAASALNKAVVELVEQAPDEPKIVRYLGSEGQTTIRQMKLVEACPNGGNYGQQMISLPGRNNVCLVFLQDCEGVAPAATRPETKPRRLRFRPALPPEAEVLIPQPIQHRSPPVLAALIEDFALPLATFNKTSDPGACSYVQLGSQPTDETLHTTSFDDRTPAFQLIEAMRAMVKYRAEGLAYEQLQQLIITQIEQHAEQVNREYERSLTDTLWQDLTKNSKRSRLIFADNATESLEREQDVSEIGYLPTTIMRGGRRVRLALVKALDDTPTFQLCIITRGNFALPLGDFNAEAGVFELTEETATSGKPKEDIVQAMLVYRVQGLPYADSYYGRFNPGKEEALLAKVNDEVGNRHSSGNKYGQSWLPLLKRYLNNPDIYPPAIQHEEVVQAATQRNILNDAGRKLLRIFGTQQQLRGSLDRTTPHYEYLLQRLYTILKTQPTAMKEGVLTDTTSGITTDDVDVKIELSREGSVYHIRLFTRPASMDNTPLVQIKESMFDITLSMPEDDEITALVDILDTIE